MKGMNMSEKVKQLLITVLLQNINAMSRDINHAIQSKLLSRYGMSSHQIIRQRNNLSTELIEQYGQLQLLMEGGTVEEKPLDLAAQVKAMIGNAPQVKTAPVEGPPGWKQDLNGHWFEIYQENMGAK